MKEFSKRFLKKKSATTWCALLCFLQSANSLAWQHEIAAGYGRGHEVEETYINSGVLLSGKIYKFRKIDNTLIASIDATIANLRSATPNDNKLTTVAGSLAMRAYFANPDYHCIRPYVQMSFGPVYLSAKKLGNCEQGAHFAFQTTAEIGIELGSQCRSWDLSIHLLHYCNAGLASPNKGFDLVPAVTIGYMF